MSSNVSCKLQAVCARNHAEISDHHIDRHGLQDRDAFLAVGSLEDVKSSPRNTSATINRTRTSSSATRTFTGFGGKSASGVTLITRVDLNRAATPFVSPLFLGYPTMRTGAVSASIGAPLSPSATL